MRSNNYLACIYTRQKTGLNVCRSFSIGIHRRTSLRRSYPRITVLTLSAAELWRSGDDGKYRSIDRALAAANLLHVAAAYWVRVDGTDRQTDSVPLHRRPASITNKTVKDQTGYLQLIFLDSLSAMLVAKMHFML